MSDLISRQAALDAMETWDKFGCDPDGKLVRYDDDKHYIPYVHYEDMVHAIKHLPSARPERTCVNCGRTVNNGGWYADGRTRCPIEEHYALPKDGYCHLWEKRSVTDDDYPERRKDEH